MIYEYSGYLKSLLYAPDWEQRDYLEHIEFTADDLAQWSLVDEANEAEWKRIPGRVTRSDEGVLLEGQFQDIAAIDELGPDQPAYWAPLSSQRWRDGRLPVHVRHFPIIELTYRCRTPHARPAWLYSYTTGAHFDGLKPVQEWRTIARRVPHFHFPEFVDYITLRLYSTSRTREAMEIKSVRFRVMSEGEREACEKHARALEQQGPAAHYPLLDQVLPLGVFMDAGTAKRLAELMELEFSDYWRLALEDIAQHHHNAIALQSMDAMSKTEWEELLRLAEFYNIRVAAMHDWPLDEIEERGPELVEKHIAPYADNNGLLAWSVETQPPESHFLHYLGARRLFEKADPNHPLVAMMREPNAFPLFAPFLAASGVTHLKAHRPWDMGTMVRAHFGQGRGQQSWVTAPAFVQATQSPKWNSCPEMRLMLNLAFANGARGWFAYTYHNDPIWVSGTCQRSLTGPFLTFSDLWSELGNRMERFNGIAPLFLNARPGAPLEVDFEFSWETYPRTKRPEGVQPVEWHWLHGPDFHLIYVIANDAVQMTPVNLKVPEHFPAGLDIYDVTDFTRNRKWSPMARERHIEMFPGQGQVILVADPAACIAWRDRIIDYMKSNDRRQIAITLAQARRYNLDVSGVQQQMKVDRYGTPLDELARLQTARDSLLNLIYSAPAIANPRSKLIQASAALCGCDGNLCRLLSNGSVDEAHELGERVTPLTRDLNRLMLRLRRGEGADIVDECDQLSRRSLEMLNEFRTAG